MAGALVVAGATLGILAARGVDLNKYKPLALLLWEAQSSDVTIADAAAEELCRRRFGGDMPDTEADRVLGVALRIHADESRRWPGPLSAFINEAMVGGRMSATEIQDYLERVARPQLVLPPGPPPRSGTPLTLSVDHRWRAGAIDPTGGPSPALWVMVWPLSPGMPAYDRELILTPQQPDPPHGAMRIAVPGGVDRYEARAMVRYELNLDQFGWGGDHPLARIAVGDPGLRAFEHEVSLAFEVAPAPQIDIALDSSDRFVEALKDLLAPELVDGGRGRVMCRFQPAELPVGIAFSAAFRDPETGAEWPTWIVLEGQERVGAHNHLIPLKGFGGNRLDLVLRPDVERLRAHLLDRREDASWTVFGEEIVLEGLEVRPR